MVHRTVMPWQAPPPGRAKMSILPKDPNFARKVGEQFVIVF